MNAASTNETRGGAETCPVCNRLAAHASTCPMRDLMALTWRGKSADQQAAEAHAK